MNCKDVVEAIPLYYYRELEDDKVECVRSHLASCADCSRLAEQLKNKFSSLETEYCNIINLISQW